MLVQLTPDQWQELRVFVNDDDQRAFQELVSIIISDRERKRKQELADARKHDSPAWLPAR